MKLEDLKHIKTILGRISVQDGHVRKAIASVERDIAIYEARKGQIRDNYDSSAVELMEEEDEG